MSKTIIVEGYVKGKEEEHYAGEIEFNLPEDWDNWSDVQKAVLIMRCEERVTEYLFKTNVRFPE